MDRLPNPFLAPAGCAAAAIAAGFATAFLRTRSRGTALVLVDVLVLFPALLPVAIVAQALALIPGLKERETLWLAAMALVSLPLAYLPPRMALAGRGNVWLALASGALLAFTRVAAELFLAIAALDRFTILTALLILLSLASSFLIARLISTR